MKLNGEVITLEKPCTIKALLLDKGYRADRVAVEVNGEIIPKATFEEATVCDDDTVEVVTFMGGG